MKVKTNGEKPEYLDPFVENPAVIWSYDRWGLTETKLSLYANKDLVYELPVITSITDGTDPITLPNAGYEEKFLILKKDTYWTSSDSCIEP